MGRSVLRPGVGPLGYTSEAGSLYSVQTLCGADQTSACESEQAGLTS